ncbi:ATP-dependent zinc protease family protein [Marinobacter sp. 1Y8]
MKTWLTLCFATSLALTAPVALAADDSTSASPADAEQLGFVEWMVLQDTGLRMKARLDTGAKTSSLHAVNVEPFEKDGEQWVKFDLPLDDHLDPESEENAGVVLEFERPVTRTVLIKRKGAESQRRYVVKMDFCIAGKTHETQFSLTDRGHFSYPALLGRRFMKDDNVLIDSADSFQAAKSCDHLSLSSLADKYKQN